MVYLAQTLYTHVFQHCPATGVQNDDEASPSIVLAGRALLIKMFITHKLRGIFCSNVAHYCILTLSNHWYAKRLGDFTEHHFGRSSSFYENAHTS